MNQFEAKILQKIEPKNKICSLSFQTGKTILRSFPTIFPTMERSEQKI